MFHTVFENVILILKRDSGRLRIYCDLYIFLKPLYDSYSIKSWHSYVHVSSITYFCLSGKKAMK